MRPGHSNRGRRSSRPAAGEIIAELAAGGVTFEFRRSGALIVRGLALVSERLREMFLNGEAGPLHAAARHFVLRVRDEHRD